jgi:hypothetical protein
MKRKERWKEDGDEGMKLSRGKRGIVAKVMKKKSVGATATTR